MDSSKLQPWTPPCLGQTSSRLKRGLPTSGTHPTADRGWHSGFSLLPGLLALKRLKSFPTSVPLG